MDDDKKIKVIDNNEDLPKDENINKTVNSSKYGKIYKPKEKLKRKQSSLLEKENSSSNNKKINRDYKKWKKIDKDLPFEDNYKKCNPNKNKLNYEMNCQRCVPTYEMRERGYDVIAKPAPEEFLEYKGDDRVNSDYLSHHPLDVWDRPQIIYISQYYKDFFESDVRILNEEKKITFHFSDKSIKILYGKLIDNIIVYKNEQEKRVYLENEIKEQNKKNKIIRVTSIEFQKVNSLDVPTVLYVTSNYKDIIINELKKWEILAGAKVRAQIIFNYKGSEIGHTIVGEYFNKEHYFIDPQEGTIDCNKSFNNVFYISFCRIDNLEPTEYIYDCCEEVQNEIL